MVRCYRNVCVSCSRQLRRPVEMRDMRKYLTAVRPTRRPGSFWHRQDASLSVVDAAPMGPALSIYLDALRFVAAFVVFLSHYATHAFSGGVLWQIEPYGRTAVLVFFVLSGVIIAWVTESREETLREFAISRIARILLGCIARTRYHGCAGRLSCRRLAGLAHRVDFAPSLCFWAKAGGST